VFSDMNIKITAGWQNSLRQQVANAFPY